MSVIDTDLEIFEPILEGISRPSRDGSKVMLESIAISNSKKILEEAETKKKKSFQKKIKAKITKEHSLINAKKVLNDLFEAVVAKNNYITDTPAKQSFVEAYNALDKSLTEMAQEEGDDFAKKYEIYKKAANGEQLTPDEQTIIDQDKQNNQDDNQSQNNQLSANQPNSNTTSDFNPSPSFIANEKKN